ncbi:MAG: ATP-binding protein [Cyanobacteria bacterium P01_G01_bin.54]
MPSPNLTPTPNPMNAEPQPDPNPQPNDGLSGGGLHGSSRWRRWLKQSRFHLGNLNIGNQLRVGFGVLVGLTFLAVGRSYLSSLHSTRYIQQTQTIRVPTVLASENAQTHLLQMQSDVRGYLATGESEFRSSYQAARQAFEQDLEKITMIAATKPDLVNAEILSEVQTAYQQWSLLPDQLFALHDNILDNQPALYQLDQAETNVLKILNLATTLQTEQSQRAGTTANHTLLRDLTDFKTAFALMVGAVQSYVSTVEPSFRFDYTQYDKETQAAWEQIRARQAQLTPSQREQFAELEALYTDFAPLPPKLFEIVEGDRAREDIYLFRTEAEPLATQMIDWLSELVAQQQQGLEQELAISHNSLVATQWQTLIVGLLALLAGLGLAYILEQRIAQRLKRLIQRTAQIALGDFDTDLPVRRQDEISTLARTFNEMTAYLRQFRQELQDANRDLEHRVADRTLELNAKNQELEQLITELKTTQSQLVQTEKMSSLGQLVAGVAHEINNPVNFIYGNVGHVERYIQELTQLLTLYQQHYPEPCLPIQEHIEEIELAYLLQDFKSIADSIRLGAVRIRSIVLSLRNFSRLDEADAKESDIHEGLDSTLLILGNQIKAKPDRPEIKITKRYGKIPLIDCYPSQLNQVFMNLLSNATDALDQHCTDHPDFQPEIEISTYFQDEQCTIKIKDNGPGIPPEIQAKIFDPFFTTKPVGQGTGLGLSISYKIVTETHRGTITVDASPDQGTAFEVVLPHHAAALAEDS